MQTDAEFEGGWWNTEFAAPPGQDLAVGTYRDARRYPFNDGAPGFNHSGNGRGCNTLTATFTIHELAYDPDDATTAVVTEFLAESRKGEVPDELYGPVVEVADHARPFDHALGLAGRDPDWQPG